MDYALAHTPSGTAAVCVQSTRHPGGGGRGSPAVRPHRQSQHGHHASGGGHTHYGERGLQRYLCQRPISNPGGTEKSRRPHTPQSHVDNRPPHTPRSHHRKEQAPVHSTHARRVSLAANSTEQQKNAAPWGITHQATWHACPCSSDVHNTTCRHARGAWSPGEAYASAVAGVTTK